ncbi:MAG: rhodanese-like domain-containing protein, partial [Anaerolineales bacterium]|nr:rhodanese-like domain-containing protein [Anaerolineales bacterium]
QGQPVEISDKPVSAGGSAYTNVNAQELNAMLKKKDFVFVNVHIPFEGNIANTDLSIPYDQITGPAYLSQLPADINAKIVLYCRSGRMSEIAAEKLVSLGYTNIWNLTGGMVEWEQAGYPLEK